MKKRNIIWIVLIIVIIILIVISLVTLRSVKICGPKAAGMFHDLSYCNIDCNSDADCKDGGGCGAINIDEECNTGSIMYDLVRMNVKCENNKCVLNGEEK